MIRGRRIRLVTVVLAVVAGTGVAWQSLHKARAARNAVRPANSAAAVDELLAGNRRYIGCSRTESIDTGSDAAVRHELSREQHPFAAILCCSDSRVCPEFIFDQRPGSLFEIRNAGNVVDDDVMGSLEYAVEHLHVPLVVIMGHTMCGAIRAVHDADGEPLHDHLRAIQSHMQLLADEIHATRGDGSQECLDRLTESNVLAQVRILLDQSTLLRHAVEQHKLALIAMVYDIDSGEAKLLKSFSSLPAEE